MAVTYVQTLEVDPDTGLPGLELALPEDFPPEAGDDFGDDELEAE